jgi:hypothetical protein
MRLIHLKQAVFEANLALVSEGLVKLTWGNASGIDRQQGLMVIKPSGISYDEMTPEDMVVMDLQGNIIDSRLNPSSDTPTHLFLYQVFSGYREHRAYPLGMGNLLGTGMPRHTLPGHHPCRSFLWSGALYPAADP